MQIREIEKILFANCRVLAGKTGRQARQAGVDNSKMDGICKK